MIALLLCGISLLNSFSDALERNCLVMTSPEWEDGRIYITSQTLPIACSMEHEENGVFSSALLTLYNSSWGQTYAMTRNNDTNNIATWSINLTHVHLMYGNTYWSPKEPWNVEIVVRLGEEGSAEDDHDEDHSEEEHAKTYHDEEEMEHSHDSGYQQRLEEERRTFKTSALLIDLHTEPLLQWELGEPSGSQPLLIVNNTAAAGAGAGYVGSVHMRRSPCSPDIALLAYTDQDEKNVHIGRSYDGFSRRDVDWFRIPAQQLCGTGCSMQLIDMQLTNRRLLLATNHGLYISNDLMKRTVTSSSTSSSTSSTSTTSSTTTSTTNKNNTSINKKSLRLTFTKVVDFTSIHCSLNVSLGYTAECEFRYHTSITGDDFVTLLYWCDDAKDRMLRYSRNDYEVWQSVSLPYPILHAAYNVHLKALSILVHKDETSAVYTYRLTEEGKMRSKARFPPFKFAVTADIQQLFYHPVSHNLYALGAQVHLSDDSGNSFQLALYLGSGDSVAQLFFSHKHTLMRTQHGGMIYGTTGLLRMLDLSVEVADYIDASTTDYMLHIDTLANVKAIHLLTSHNVITTGMNITHMIEASRVSVSRALGYQLIRTNEAVLYEYVPHGSVSVFSNASVGQEIRHKVFGYGYISEVIFCSFPTFLIEVHVLIKEQFPLHRKELSIENTIDIISTNQTSQESILLLSPGTVGWEATDIYKTVMLPSSSNILLLKYINSSHIVGLSIIPYMQYVAHTPYQWAIIDFSPHAWWMQEAACKLLLNVPPLFRRNTIFDLDVGDAITLNVESFVNEDEHVEDEEHESNVATLYKPHHLATLSNPWQFEVKSSNQLHDSAVLLNILIRCTVLRRGITAVRITLPMASHRCHITGYVFTFYAGCPCSKRLRFHYPEQISRHDFLYGNPSSKGGKALLETLPPNYRPPSELGISVPTNEHIYNADPAITRKEHFHISQRSGSYKQCDGARTKEECGCTEEMEYSTLTQHSDCRRRVYKLQWPGIITPNLSIDQHHRDPIFLTTAQLIILYEVNNRYPSIKSVTRKDSVLDLITSNKDLHFDNALIYDSTELEITLNGSGLYHFHVELVPGYSFCQLKEEFQLYVHTPPLPQTIIYILDYTTAVIFGGVLFTIYLMYLHRKSIAAHKDAVWAAERRATLEAQHPGMADLYTPSPRASPRGTPRGSPRGTPRGSPRGSPRGTPRCQSPYAY